MTGDVNDVGVLRAALAARDLARVASLLPVTPMAVPFANRRPRVAMTDEGRVLPVFLSMDAWESFRSGDEVRLLQGDALRALIEATGADAVLVDAASDALQIPASEFLALLRGEYVDPQGRRVVKAARFEPAPTLLAAVVPHLPAALADALADRAWVVGRVVAGGSVPTVAVAADVAAGELEQLRAALGGSGVCDDLEVVHLDPETTAEATSGWTEARVGPLAGR